MSKPPVKKFKQANLSTFINPGLQSLNAQVTTTEATNVSRATDENNQSSVALCSQVSSCTDIGMIIPRNLTDHEKLSVLDHVFSPSATFQWPYTERKEGVKVRRKYLGPQHFSGIYSVFDFSVAKSGVYCKPCVLFAPPVVSNVKLQRLISEPLQKYSHLTGKDGYLTSHIGSAFHENSVMAANAFRDVVSGKSQSVTGQLEAASAKEVTANRAALKRILQAIEFLGRLGMSLRGHRDSGVLDTMSGKKSMKFINIFCPYRCLVKRLSIFSYSR